MSANGRQFLPLGECCQIVSGATPRTDNSAYWDGDIPWVTPKDMSGLDGAVMDQPERSITREGFESCSTTMLPKGAILFSSRAPIGHVAIAGRPMCTNQGFKSLVPDPTKLDSYYLYHCMKRYAPDVARLGRGATFKEVSKGIVEEFRIPVPPLAEQRRIAATLDKAVSIRHQRAHATKIREELRGNAFLGLFGHPLANDKGWPAQSLDTLGEVVTGRTPPTAEAGMFGGSIPFATPADIDDGLQHTERTVTEAGALQSRTVRPGSSLVCCISTIIGKVARTPKRTAFNQQINAVDWNVSINDWYGAHALSLMQPVIQSRATSTTVTMLNKSQFCRIQIPVPPRALQDRFGDIAETLSRQGAVIRDACSTADRLANALQEQFFQVGN
ncbi:MAG TPA: restriction endonuclease subunit S [Candidatus Thermoplasmatota archaeon]|nr:restriction endonuclease subunit S [Candidatus Thermoplasmatota archaeon]